MGKSGKTYESPDMADFIGRTLRAMVRRAGEGDREALSALARVGDELDVALNDAVHAIRAKGNSWTDVARELGVTRQAAQARWGHRAPPRCLAADGPGKVHISCHDTETCQLFASGLMGAPC